MAWFAGIDVRRLNQVGSDWCLYDSLGTLVAALSCLNGVSAAIAVGYVVDKPAVDLWWFGAMWTCLVVCVERVILQLPNSNDWVSALGSFAWRAALSVLLAFLLTEPIIMLFNQKEINSQLDHNVRVAIEREHDAIDADYKEKSSDAHAKLRRTRSRKAELETKLAADEKRQAVAEAAGLTGVAIANAGFARMHERRLAAAIERNGRWQPELREQLGNLAGDRSKEKRKAQKEIEDGNGFQARVAALSDVQAKWSSTNYMIWGLRFLFLFLDLTPLVATLVYRRRPGGQPYEERRIAAWEWDSLAALKVREAVRVEKQRIREAARGEIRVNQAHIAADVERRIYGTVSDDLHDLSGMGSPVSAMSFDEFVDEIQDYDSRPVDVPEELRGRALLGFAALGVAAAFAFLLSSSLGAAVAGGWILLIAFGLATALCVYTSGFRQAPAWAMRPILATFIAGLALPVFVLVLNIV